MGAGSLLKDFATWTSAHGVPQIGGASRMWVKLLWTAIFISFFGVLVYQCYNIFSRYFSWPSAVSLSVDFAERPFPVVTVCSLNPFRSSFVAAQPAPNPILDTVAAYESAMTNPTAGDQAFAFHGLSTKLEVQHRSHDSLVFAAAAAAPWAAGLTYSFDQLVLECAYMGEKCTAADFTRIEDPVFGACYQFNNDGSYKNDRSGQSSGLSLTLSANKEDYLRTTEQTGAIVGITTQGQHPQLEDFGFHASSGYVNAFAVEMTHLTRLPSPYGDCTDEPGSQAIHFDGDYTRENCLRSCYQDKVIAECGCGDPRLPVPDGSTKCGLGDYDRVMNMSARQQESPGTPREEGAEAVASPVEGCDCPMRCTEDILSVVPGHARFPSSEQLAVIEQCEMIRAWHNPAIPYHSVTNPRPPACPAPQFPNTTTECTVAACIEWYGGNGLKVDVYFESLNYRRLISVPAISFLDALQTFGGQLGLWTGASVITLLEMGSFLVVIVTYMCTSTFCHKKRKHHAAGDEDDFIDDLGKDGSSSSSSGECSGSSMSGMSGEEGAKSDGFNSSELMATSSSDSSSSSDDEAVKMAVDAAMGGKRTPPDIASAAPASRC